MMYAYRVKDEDGEIVVLATSLGDAITGWRSWAAGRGFTEPGQPLSVELLDCEMTIVTSSSLELLTLEDPEDDEGYGVDWEIH